jgi:4-nitrophenyl phosphatase
VMTPLDIIGAVITERFGRSQVLVIGAPEMSAVVAGAGHDLVDVKDHAEAGVLALGNDFDLTYERLTVASRVAARTGALVTPNVDPRLPIEGGEFLPGCGALVAAVAAASGVTPIVVGKPAPPLFRIALERLGLLPGDAAMVGDSLASDMAGGRGVGMRTVYYAPEGPDGADAADVTVRSFAELARLAGV